jgi:hypothetical protein
MSAYERESQEAEANLADARKQAKKKKRDSSVSSKPKAAD